jgi:hypothetical protein
VRPLAQIDGQKNAELAGGKVMAVPAYEGHDGIPKNPNQLIRAILNCHCTPSFKHRVTSYLPGER